MWEGISDINSAAGVMILYLEESKESTKNVNKCHRL
jgi:hypothetical protein